MPLAKMPGSFEGILPGFYNFVNFLIYTIFDGAVPKISEV